MRRVNLTPGTQLGIYGEELGLNGQTIMSGMGE